MAFQQQPRSNFDIEDTESWSNQKNITFSHQDLVMRSMKRVIEVGGHELAKGINDVSFDKSSNVQKTIYREDTRIAFKQAIKMCKFVMNCDFDTVAEKEIKLIEDKLTELKDYFLKRQYDWWNSLNQMQKKSTGIKSVLPNFFNKDLPFYEEYLEQEIELYSMMFEKLNDLTKRLKFYQSSDFEA